MCDLICGGHIGFYSFTPIARLVSYGFKREPEVRFREFLIFIDDLPENIRSSVLLFADDACLV